MWRLWRPLRNVVIAEEHRATVPSPAGTQQSVARHGSAGNRHQTDRVPAGTAQSDRLLLHPQSMPFKASNPERVGLEQCYSVPSLSGLDHFVSLPGTSVPGYRLLRPFGTGAVVRCSLDLLSGRVILKSRLDTKQDSPILATSRDGAVNPGTI
jgi:hypothetical protein